MRLRDTALTVAVLIAGLPVLAQTINRAQTENIDPVEQWPVPGCPPRCDGSYHGQLTADGKNATNCAKNAPVQMTVTNNILEYVHRGHATITATVGADGSFRGSTQSMSSGRSTPPVVLEGQIAGDAIRATTLVANDCSYQLTLKRSQ